MKIYNVNFDESSFGITRKSLLRLRNAIAENIREKLFMVEVATSKITCGFFVFVHYNTGVVSAIWTGDGFRTDGGGEGGRGYASAMKILSLFGIDNHNLSDSNVIQEWEIMNTIINEKERRGKILFLSQKTLDEFTGEDGDSHFASVYETYPRY